MPANFQHSSCITKNILHLQLRGEFNGSAAGEFNKKIEEDGSGASKILVDTTELRVFHPFGRTVFQNRRNASCGAVLLHVVSVKPLYALC
jgi:hypothetical protein